MQERINFAKKEIEKMEKERESYSRNIPLGIGWTLNNLTADKR